MRVLYLLITCIGLLLSGCGEKENFNKNTIKIKTNYGNIYVELFPDKAPITANAFLNFVDSGYFKNTSFYRVMKKEDQAMNVFKIDLIQGGLWQTDNKRQLSIPGIEHESTKKTGLLHKRGSFSLARAELGTASTEFFICLEDEPVYDYGGGASPEGEGFAVFGKVVKGLQVARKIHENPDNNTIFKRPIKIINIVRVK